MSFLANYLGPYNRLSDESSFLSRQYYLFQPITFLSESCIKIKNVQDASFYQNIAHYGDTAVRMGLQDPVIWIKSYVNIDIQIAKNLIDDNNALV